MILTIIGMLLRLFGYAEEAKAIFASYEARKSAQRISDVQASVNQLSDSGVADELRKYDRPD